MNYKLCFFFFSSRATRVKLMEGILTYLKGLDAQLSAALDNNPDELSEQDTLLVQNAFQEIDGMEFRLACHHDGSFLVEKLVRLASSFQIRVFWDRLSGCFGRMASHRYASHVLEAILNRSMLYNNNGDEMQDEADNTTETGVLASLKEMISRFEAEILADLQILAKDVYASHVLRSFIANFQPSSDLIDYFKENHKAFWCDPQGSLVLQKVMEKHQVFSSHEVDAAFFKDTAFDKIGSRTWEAFLQSLTDKDAYMQFYQKHFRGHLAQMVKDRTANFVVQALIAFCPSENLFELVLSELKEHVEQREIVAKMGVVFKVMDWPVRHTRSFPSAISFLYHVFEAKTPSERQGLVRTLKQSKIGLSILALIPRYPKDDAKFIVDGFLDLQDEDIKQLCLDKTSAHTIESFVSGENNLSAKARNKIIRKLLANVAEIACHPSGSFVVEVAFSASPIDVKEAMAEQLSKNRKRVEDSRSGLIVMKKCRVEEFDRNRDSWKASQESAFKKRSIIDDIFGGDHNKKSRNH